MINSDVNAKNQLIKKCVVKNIFWNPRNCQCECGKSCDVEKYLDYKNCKYKKKLINKLVEECSENIDGNEVIYNGTLNDCGKIWDSCTVYIVLLSIFFIKSISISSFFIYFHWYLKRRYTETTDY